MLILGGVLLVELRLTGTFPWLFVCLGALSLVVQVVTYRARAAASKVRLVTPRRVPSIVDGRIVLEDR